MLSGQQKSKKNIELFLNWMSSTTDDDYRQIIFRGKLNRIQVSKECGFAKSVLQQNPKVKELLLNLENSLRERKVLPILTSQGKSKFIEPIPHKKYKIQNTSDSKRIAILEQKILELEAKLKRYQEIAEVVSEMGFDI